MTPIPAILLTGCLGAGKTTFLNQLLATEEIASKNVALIINEFGPVGVDSTLVRETGHPKYEINRGSLFCICTRVDFINVLKDMTSRGDTELLLIEATGIAETSDIESFLDEPVLEGRFRVSANICIVDAANFTKVAAYMKSARRQVEWADGIVINKTDLVPESDVSHLARVLQGMNADAAITQACNAEVEYSFIESITHKRHEGGLAKEPPQDIFAVSMRTDGRVDHEKFSSAVKALGDSILRMKGYIDFGEGPHYCEAVYDRMIEKPEIKGPSPTSEFTVISYGIGRDEVEKVFEGTFTKSGD